MAFSLLLSWLCMPTNELSVRARLEREVSVVSGGQLAAAEWLFKLFASPCLCKISCDAVLVVQLRKRSSALLSRLPLQLLHASVMGTEAGSRLSPVLLVLPYAAAVT